MKDVPSEDSGNSPAADSGISRIALFGGTFDPVHRGHLGMARAAVDALALDRMIFLPCRISPHKSQPPGADADQRLEMLRLATQGIAWAEISDHDLVAEPPVYSHRTVEHFRRLHPGAQLFWLLGADQWQALPDWREPERLARELEFIVATRGEAAPKPRPGWRWHPLEIDIPVSASGIREQIARGALPEAQLDPAVAGYIRETGLYRA